MFCATCAKAEDLSAECVLGTPLGLPVVPDVYKMTEILSFFAEG